MSSSSRRTIYLLYLLHLRRKYLQRRKVNFWVDPLIKVRYLKGSYYTLFDKLKMNNKQFFNYFRMTQETFNYLLENLCETIQKKDTKFFQKQFSTERTDRKTVYPLTPSVQSVEFEYYVCRTVEFAKTVLVWLMQRIE